MPIKELYYMHIPGPLRPVAHGVKFLSVQEFLEDEEACRAMWSMIGELFNTRGKFLAVWPGVRYLSLYKEEGRTAGMLLVSAHQSWQIDYVMVQQDMRRRGIAESLINETLNQATVHKVPYVMLSSADSLRKLYEEECGFAVVGESADP